MKEQNLDRQLIALREQGIDERDIIMDKDSGKDFDRCGYQSLKTTMLKPGDTLVVKSLDRLSRNKRDIKNELEFFKDHHVRLKVIDLPTTLMELPEDQAWVFDMVNNILIESLEQLRSRNASRSGSVSQRASWRHIIEAWCLGGRAFRSHRIGTV